MIPRLVRFARLAAWERRVLVEALVLLPLTALRIRRLGMMRALEPGPAPAPAAPRNGDETQRARRIARLVDWVARHGPYRASCLPMSLTLQRLLRARGIEARLRLGVRMSGERLEAHAWIERDGEALMEAAHIGERFAAFAEPVVPRMGELR